MTRREYVSRAGEKLAHALREFGVDPSGLRCADFGCNAGGFTDCLLQQGAARVYAIDTGYGVLDWRLRNDPRVTVMERTNALHAPAPGAESGGPVDLVVMDMGWTPQRLAVPAGLRWLAPGVDGRIITLVKPHYEASAGGARVRRGVLSVEEAEAVMRRVEAEMPVLGVRVQGVTPSPIVGKAKRNSEYLMVLGRAAPGDSGGSVKVS